MNLVHILSIASALALVTAATVDAQQASMRLSSAEGVTRSLPVAMRVQSAARIGERTLACWGTVELDAAGVARNVLRVQMGLHGSPDDAAAIRLHSEAGRPSGVLHVASAVDRFDVYWGDLRRNAPGLYMRSFDIDGNPTSPERLIVPGEIEDILTYSSIGEMIVLKRDSSTVLLNVDGTVDPRALDPRRFALPHVLRNDSSLVVLDGRRLDVYRHFLDAARSSSMDLELEDSTFSNAWMLSNVGNAVVVTAVIAKRRIECEDRFSGEGVVLRQIRLDDSLRVTGSTDVDSVAECVFEERPFEVSQVVRERLDGGFRIDVVFRQYPNVTRVHSFSVLACGDVERGERASVTCRPREEVIARVMSDSMSSVAIGGAPFTTPIDAHDLGLADARPNVVASRGGTLVTWMRRVEPPEPFGGMSVYLTRWTGPTLEHLGVVAGNVGEFNIDGPDQSITYDDRAYWFERPGATGVVRTEYVDVLWGNDQGSFKMDLATADGWKRVDEEAGNNARYGRPIVATNPNDATTVFSIDAPEGQRTVVAARDGSVVNRVRLAEGLPHHLIPISIAEWIAVGTAAAASELVRINETSVLSRAPRPMDSAMEEIWQRELGPTFIRVSLSRADRSLLIQRYDFDLAIIDSLRVPLAVDAIDLSVVLNHADSSLGVLYVTGWDVRMTSIARDLSVRARDYLVYAGLDSVRHPAGAIVDGTLHAAWQDFRNRDADIYGIEVDGPFSGVDAMRSAETSARVLTVIAAPVPASDAIAITITGATSDALLSLVDVRGREVMSRRLSGSSRVTLDISKLAPGFYVARVVDRSEVASYRVMVARPAR